MEKKMCKIIFILEESLCDPLILRSGKRAGVLSVKQKLSRIIVSTVKFV